MKTSLFLSVSALVLALCGHANAAPALTDDIQPVNGATLPKRFTAHPNVAAGSPAVATPVAMAPVATAAAGTVVAPSPFAQGAPVASEPVSAATVLPTTAPAAQPVPAAQTVAAQPEIQRPGTPSAAPAGSAFGAPWSPTGNSANVAPGGYPGGPGQGFGTMVVNTSASQAPGAVPPPNQNEAAHDAALTQALQNLLPPPEDVTRVRQAGVDTARAAAAPIGMPPRPVTRHVAVTLQPGEQPPVLNLSFGAVTALTFADVTGAPWNIKSVVVDDTAYGVTSVSEKDKTNIVSVYPKERFTDGRNLVVTLDGFPMPVIFTLQTGGAKTVDYRADVQVMKRGPNARTDFVQDNLSPTEDTTMQAFIDGTPPEGARKLNSSNNGVEAWRYKDMMYVRTALRVVSPAPTRESSSNLSGVTVYAMPEAPDIIITQDGQFSSVIIGR